MYLRTIACALMLCGFALALVQQPVERPAPPIMEPAPPPRAAQTSSKKHKHHSVRLKWRASKTKGIAGYYVYRAEGGRSADYIRLTPKPIMKTSFEDRKVKPGNTYWYAVSAVQKLGKKEVESVRTPPAKAQIPKP